MTPLQPFLTDALSQIERGLVHVIASANLHVRTAPISRRLAGRLGGQVRALEVLLRRFLMLMALALLPGLPPRAPQATTKHPRSTPKPKRPRAFRLLPAPLDVAGSHGFPDTPRARGPVPLRKIALKMARLQTALSAPDAHAKRLAFHLRRLMEAGEARPVVLPARAPRRIGRELALISDILPVHLKAALAVWPNTS